VPPGGEQGRASLKCALRRNYKVSVVYKISVPLTALGFCCGMCVTVPLHPVQEFLPTFRVFHMLNTKVHPLLDVAVANDLVNDNTDSVGSDVVDNAGTPERPF